MLRLLSLPVAPLLEQMEVLHHVIGVGSTRTWKMGTFLSLLVYQLTSQPL